MRWAWSYVVWGLWILLFLALELPGDWRWVPWVTLSETSWHLEAYSWAIHAVFFGFLIGLCIHIVFHGPLWRSELVGMLVSFGLHLVNRHWA